MDAAWSGDMPGCASAKSGYKDPIPSPETEGTKRSKNVRKPAEIRAGGRVAFGEERTIFDAAWGWPPVPDHAASPRAIGKWSGFDLEPCWLRPPAERVKSV